MKSTNALLERARAHGGDRDATRSRRVAGVVASRGRRPSGRALVGGLLVAIAAVGAFVLATPTPHAAIRYVVAAHSVEPGTRLTTADLTTVPVDLPPEQAALAFTEPSTLVGATSLGPLASGQLVQGPALARGPLSPFEVSLSVDSDRALDGHLESGEHVAVLATYGSGPDAVTLTVASTALVERLSKPTGLAVGTKDVVTLGLQAEADVDAVVHAARAGELTLVRTDSATLGLAYRPTVVPDALEAAP
jgi:hypothetical protein